MENDRIRKCGVGIAVSLVLATSFVGAAEGPASVSNETHAPLLTGAPVATGLEGREPPAASEPLPALRHEERPYWRTNLFKRVLLDQKFLVVHWWPAEFSRVGFSAPLIAATVAAATSSGDEPGLDLRLERSVHDLAGGGSNGLAKNLTRLGNGSTGAVLIGATYLAARLGGNNHLARATSLSAEALLNVGIWTTAIKHLTARARPAAGGQGEFFDFNPSGAEEVTSFPSGHATGAFAVATVFAEEYPHAHWVRWFAYGMAGMIAASRVALGRHFPSDVVVGALLGHSLGKMVEARQHGEEERPAGRLEPIFDPANGGYGVAYRYSW